MRSAITIMVCLALAIGAIVSIQTLVHLRNDPEVRAELADPKRAPDAPPPAGDPDYRRRVLVTQLGTGLALLTSCGAILLLGVAWSGKRSSNVDEPEIRDERRHRTATYERLRERDRRATVGRLASSVSHSLGTPINVISGRAQLIAAGLPEDEVRASARTIGEQSRKLVEIVAAVAAYGHQHATRRERHRVSDVVGEAAALIEPLSDDVVLAVVVDETLEADVDREAAVQLLTALGARALASAPPGAAVTLSADTEQVDAPADKRCSAGRYLRLTVEDDGPALDSDPRHVFDPITRAAGDGNPIIGLAPYICKAITREQGGWIELARRDGGGNRFDAWLRQGGGV